MVKMWLLVALVATPANALANAGRIVALSGEVTLTREGEDLTVTRGMYIQQGDTIATSEDANVRLLMRDKSVLALTGDSRVKIAQYDVEPETKQHKAKLKILVGRLWALVSKTVNPDATYEVETSNAVAGVRGTELVFDVDAEGGSTVTVIEGVVDLASDDAAETLGGREIGSVADAGAIDLASTSEEGIAAIQSAVRPEQDLDEAKAQRRLQLMRKKKQSDGDSVEMREQQERGAARDDPGTGDSVFEDTPPTEEGNDFFLGGFDPSTMARVRVRVEVRP